MVYVSLENYKKLLEDIDGVSVEELKRIEEKSSYNFNYYYFEKNGITYILFGESDDIDETKGGWCVNDAKLFVGCSGTSEDIETIYVKEKILDKKVLLQIVVEDVPHEYQTRLLEYLK